jgi:cytoskeleton protein RodZ
MSFKNEKNKKNSFLNKNKKVDASVSDAINEAFDNVELSTVGKLCLDARLNKGITQEQAGALLKVRVKIIKDFEDGENIDLPGLAYKVGFVRSYARLLDLDGDSLVQEFKEGLELNSFKEEYKFLTPELNKNNFLPIGAVVSVFIAILSYTGWYYSDRSNKIEHMAVQKIEDISKKTAEIDNNSYVIIEEDFSNNLPSSKINNDVKTVQEVNLKTNLNEDKVESMISKNTELSATANERDPSTELVLKATGNSWVEIEDMEGNILMTRLMRPGETYVVPDINGLTFNTGNAGALSLSQGDVILPKLGEVGEIITAQPLNIKTFSNKPLLD